MCAVGSVGVGGLDAALDVAVADGGVAVCEAADAVPLGGVCRAVARSLSGRLLRC